MILDVVSMSETETVDGDGGMLSCGSAVAGEVMVMAWDLFNDV